MPRRRPGEFLADRMYNLTTARKGEVDDYEMRRLAGARPLKSSTINFDRQDLERVFAPMAGNLQIQIGRDYWWVRYDIR